MRETAKKLVRVLVAAQDAVSANEQEEMGAPSHALDELDKHLKAALRLAKQLRKEDA